MIGAPPNALEKASVKGELADFTRFVADELHASAKLKADSVPGSS